MDADPSTHSTPPAYDPSGEPLRYRVNPCDIARFALLGPVGDALAALWSLFTRGTECPCCLGTRLTLAIVLAFAAGAVLC